MTNPVRARVLFSVDEADKVGILLWRSHDLVSLPQEESSGLDYDLIVTPKDELSVVVWYGYLILKRELLVCDFAYANL